MWTEWTELRTEWKECDGKVWNMMERLEWCWNDVRASEMDLAKFYVTQQIKMQKNFKKSWHVS